MIWWWWWNPKTLSKGGKRKNKERDDPSGESQRAQIGLRISTKKRKLLEAPKCQHEYEYPCVTNIQKCICNICYGSSSIMPYLTLNISFF
jgi:hypothetical protein